MRKPFECIVGIRAANAGSGVGLFNEQLARRLKVPYCLLDEPDWTRSDGCLFSFKFEELPARQRTWLRGWLDRNNQPPFGLFLHTLDHDDLETDMVQRASVLFAGNDAIIRQLGKRQPAPPLVRAFAPGLLPESLVTTARPVPIEFFYFGMASKLDRPRFVRLRELLGDLKHETRLLCSLSVHQTSDGSCLASAQDFLRGQFGEQFLFLGTLTDPGLAYLLNGQRVFLGFYRQGVRNNNTTFNTALQFGCPVITNVDDDSPRELLGNSMILDLDTATQETLHAFLRQPWRQSAAAPSPFTWDRLVRLLEQPLVQPRRQVA